VPSEGVTFTVHPNGRILYAPASAAGGVVAIETATMKATATIPIARVLDGAGMAISPDGSSLYVVVGCEPGTCAARIAIVDLAQNTIAGFIDEPRLVLSAQLAISPSGQLAYHFASSNHPILAIDLVSRTVVGEIEATAEDVEFAADGARAYATSTGARAAAGVVVIDTQTHGIVDTIPLPDFERPHGIGVSPATGFLYVTDFQAKVDDEVEQEPGVAVIDPSSRTVIALLNTFGNNPTDVALARAPEGLCAGDEMRESKVTVGELVTSVNFAIDGCPGEQQLEGSMSPALSSEVGK
jgi:DNA-binding beta-propeller fold protein YncE